MREERKEKERRRRKNRVRKKTKKVKGVREERVSLGKILMGKNKNRRTQLGRR